MTPRHEEIKKRLAVEYGLIRCPRCWRKLVVYERMGVPVTSSCQCGFPGKPLEAPR